MILIIDVDNKQIFVDDDTTPADLERIMKKAYKNFTVCSVNDMIDEIFEEAERPIIWNPDFNKFSDEGYLSSSTFDEN